MAEREGGMEKEMSERKRDGEVWMGDGIHGRQVVFPH